MLNSFVQAHPNKIEQEIIPVQITGNTSVHITDRDILDFLMPLSKDYPNIDIWFLAKVLPGLEDNSRKIFVHVRNEKIVALAIAKKSNREKKICTVRVSPDFTGKGIGVKLFIEAMNWLETSMPHLTVSEDKLPLFSKIFDHFGYKITSTHKSRYIPGKVEYLYNQDNSFI